MKRIAISFLLILLAACSDQASNQQQESLFKEGVHYTKISNIPTSTSPQVVKFISYACPSCRFLEQKLSINPLIFPEGTQVERSPVAFKREGWRDLAHVYATLRGLNLHDLLSDELFKAVQDQRINLSNVNSFVAWAAPLSGTQPSVLEEAYLHQQTEELVTHYLAAEQRYFINSVPTVIINGNLRVNLEKIPGETEAERLASLQSLINELLSST